MIHNATSLHIIWGSLYDLAYQSACAGQKLRRKGISTIMEGLEQSNATKMKIQQHQFKLTLIKGLMLICSVLLKRFRYRPCQNSTINKIWPRQGRRSWADVSSFRESSRSSLSSHLSSCTGLAAWLTKTELCNSFYSYSQF